MEIRNGSISPLTLLEDDLVFNCELCVFEQTLESKYLIPVSELSTSNLKTVF